MTDLPLLLSSEQDEVCRTLGEELAQASCPICARTTAARPTGLFRGFRQTIADGDSGASTWARRLAQEVGGDGLPPAEVLSALACLERAVRLHLVRSIHHKRSLLEALETAASGVEAMRRAAVDSVTAGEHGGAKASPAPEASPDGKPLPQADLVGLIEGADVFICLANLQGQPFYLNPGGRRLIGLGADAAVEPTLFHRLHGDQAWSDLRHRAFPVVKEQGHWEGASRLQHLQTHEPIDVMTSMFLVRRPGSERPTCLALTHRLLSSLEASHAEIEGRKHAILESSLDPIITIDHEGVITEFNRAAESTFGHGRQKVLGTRPSEVLFPPGKSEGHKNRIDRYLDLGEGSLLGQRVEVMAVRAGGETFPAEMAMTISQERGAPVMTFFVRDISERKKAERDQAQYAAELERSNRELEQFAYVASHDLQEPLRKIRTFSDRLEVKCGDDLDETGRQCIARMQDAAGRMQQLIEGLLTLSRVTTRGKSFAPVDLAEIAAEVVRDLEVQIENLNARVEIGKLPTIEADRLQMRQLLQNLIGNALKFHRVGEPPLVKVEGHFLHRPGQRGPGSTGRERCRVTVEDNGVGIEERHRQRIFDVFQRLHPRDVYEGTGVGLAICRKIVERHGGEISVHGRKGGGTIFEVLLPAIHRRGKRSGK